MKAILRAHPESPIALAGAARHPRSMPGRHAALAAAVAVIWGVNFVVIHVGLEHFPPLLFAALLFAALRFCLVALALPFVPRPGVPKRYVVAGGDRRHR